MQTNKTTTITTVTTTIFSVNKCDWSGESADIKVTTTDDDKMSIELYDGDLVLTGKLFSVVLPDPENPGDFDTSRWWEFSYEGSAFANVHEIEADDWVASSPDSDYERTTDNPATAVAQLAFNLI